MKRIGKVFSYKVTSEHRCQIKSRNKFVTLLQEWVGLPSFSQLRARCNICVHESRAYAVFILIAANNLGLDAIFVYTRHGQMASVISRNRPNPPIFAFTNDSSTRMGLTLQWGVTPVLVDLSDDMEANITRSVDLLKTKGLIKSGDTVLVVSDIIPTSTTQTVFQSIQVKTIV